MALSCEDIPAATVREPVPRVSDCSVAAVTVTESEADTDPEVAVTVAFPVVNPWSNPVGVAMATSGFELV
jgi:hypothetical protein